MKCVLAFFSSLWLGFWRWYADLRPGQIRSARYELTAYALVALALAIVVSLA